MLRELETRLGRLEKQTTTLNQILERYPALTGDSKTWLDLFPEVKALLDPDLPEADLLARLIAIDEQLTWFRQRVFTLERTLTTLNRNCTLLLNYLGYDPVAQLTAHDPATKPISQ